MLLYTYYFQVFEQGKTWPDIAPVTHRFADREAAIAHGRLLSALHFGAEVRMTDNWKLLDGTYIKSK